MIARPLRRRAVRYATPAVIGVLLNLAGSGLAAQEATYSYTPVSVPGATSTVIWGVNRNGDVAGQYIDVSGKTHGFVRRHDRFTSIDYPDAVFTQVRGINAAGDLTGAYRLPGEPNFYLHGFILTTDGRFKKVDVPGHLNAVAVRLLADGTIIGCYHDTDAVAGMHGVKLTGQSVVDLDRPTSMHTGATPDAKTIVGYYTDTTGAGSRQRGYVLEGSTFTPFDLPDSTLTMAQDINSVGAIVGFYRSAGKVHGFVRERDGYVTLDAPGASDTRANSITDEGMVAGSFVDASGTTRGFVASRRKK